MGAYVTPKQIERLVNPLLGDFLSKNADDIARVGKRELHEITGLARYKTGQISRKEMLDAGTMVQNFELTDNVPKGTMVELDLNNNTSTYYNGDVIDLDDVDVPKHSPKPNDYEANDSVQPKNGWDGEYMWSVSEQHIMLGMNDICDTYHGRIFTEDTVPRKPHQHCNCKLIPVDKNRQRIVTEITRDLDGNRWDSRQYKGKGNSSGTSKPLNSGGAVSDIAGDVASAVLVSSLGITGPVGIAVGIGADILLDKVFAQVAGGLDKFVAENNVLSTVFDVIQTAQLAMDVTNLFKAGKGVDGVDELLGMFDPNAQKMFKEGRGLYKSGKSFIGDGTAENISNNVKKHIATTSKDKLNNYLLDNVKGYKMAAESTRLLDKMHKKLPKVKTASEGLELMSDIVNLGDKMGLKTSDIVNQKLLSKSKAKIILLESGMERMRKNGLVLY